MKITFQNNKDPKTVAQLNETVQSWHHRQHPKVYKPYNFEAVLLWCEQKLAQENTHIIIAYDEEKPIGYALLMRPNNSQSPFTQDDIKVVILDQMAVIESYQNQGVGTLIIQEIIRFCQQKKIDMLRLTVWSDNSAAKKLYQKMGFSSFMERMELRIEHG